MILVTGATGHIGNGLVRQLLARQHKVRALVLPGEDLAPLADRKSRSSKEMCLIQETWLRFYRVQMQYFTWPA